jgi:hypothetical protein
VTSLGPSITAENQRNVRHFLTAVKVGNRNGEQSISDEKQQKDKGFTDYRKINLLRSSSRKQ